MREGQSGDGDSAVTLTEHIMGEGDSADKARSQRAWGNDGDNGGKAPPQAAAGVARVGSWKAVEGRRRGSAASTRDAIVPDAMVMAATPPREWGGDPGGGWFQGTFWA